MKKVLIANLIFMFSLVPLMPAKSNEIYWLVLGSYRQGPGGRPEVSGITSPSVYAIPMNSLKQCNEAGKKIFKEIYKPVWQFDSRWTCVAGRDL